MIAALLMMALMTNLPTVKASGTIYIRADGSIYPPTAQIQRDFAGALSVPPPTEWNKTYGGADREVANSVVQTSDGGYAIAGNTWYFGAGDSVFWLIKVESPPTHDTTITGARVSLGTTGLTSPLRMRQLLEK